MSLAIEELSQPISEDLPSGENLEYDAQYLEMENLFRSDSGPPVDVKGAESMPAGPDWKGIAKLAGQLRKRTHDLRVQVYSAIASVHTQTLNDLQQNLELLKRYLDGYWASVHPQLDPDDGNDPTLRLNILQMLNQHSLMPMALEHVELVVLERVGSFSYHDIKLALGNESPAEDEEVPDVKLVRQAFASAPDGYLEGLRSTVSNCIELFAEMDEIWKEKTDDKQAPFKDTETVKTIEKIGSILGEFGPEPAETLAEGENVNVTDSAAAPVVTGTVNNRSDVIRVLDRVCDYYAANEPSSPIPLLLRRAQRLVEKSFMEILEDMVPDGVQQARLVSGKEDED